MDLIIIFLLVFSIHIEFYNYKGILQSFFFFLRFYLFIFREEKAGRQSGRETSMCGCFLCAPQLGTWPATQACALTENWTSDPLVCRLALNLWATPARAFSKIFILFIFREREREEEREGEKHRCVRETDWLCLACLHLGITATQACALTGNWTSDLLVHRMTPSPLNHTS